ncbi:MAG TPA: class II fructose-bisphosphate aldolase [Anaerolineae bacterium]|nr:class II fructose-bisphosphate aldolase [Anaerolineae bacterium]
MSIANIKELLIKASKENYAVGAFNITSLVQMEAIIEAAVDRKAPVIIQTSVTPVKFLDKDVLVAVYRTLAKKAPVPVVLHLDHCRDVDLCKQCAKAGYTNIMIDASKQKFDENIHQTKEVVDFCHSLQGVFVEGELGTVSGVEDQIKVIEDESKLCNPHEALEFVERSGVDLLAPAIGTAHGIYKTKNPKVDFERLENIFNLINGQAVRVPLVIHGGTGLPRETVQRLVALGGAKVNVSTELKHTLIDTGFKYINEHRDEYNPGKIDVAVKNAIKEVVYKWIDIIGSAGKV